MDLMEQYYHKNHHVYFDNFHSSPKLLKDLAAKDTFACGTMRIDHGLFSDDFKYSKVAVGDSIFIHEDNIVSVHWKDKRDVFLISSIHNNECVDVPKRKDEIISKPTMIIQYHTYMGRVDKCDQYLSYYSLGPKSIKWQKKVFFRLFELCIINAMVVYFNKNIAFSKRRQAHKLFCEILAHELVQLLLDNVLMVMLMLRVLAEDLSAMM